MRKNLSALVALSIAFGAGAGHAATLSEGRIKEILRSRDSNEVELETLRSRDRKVLIGLAEALSGKYGELLAGSEVVFTRIIDNGVVFYRLDFLNLKNEARARALCEILEMDSCMAVDSHGEMQLLGTAHGRDVAALGRMTQPFEFTPSNKTQSNPKKHEIEARARELLDPLSVFPIKRPYLGPKLDIYPMPRPDLPSAKEVAVVEYFEDDAQLDEVQSIDPEAVPSTEADPKGFEAPVVDEVPEAIDLAPEEETATEPASASHQDAEAAFTPPVAKAADDEAPVVDDEIRELDKVEKPSASFGASYGEDYIEVADATAFVAYAEPVSRMASKPEANRTHRNITVKLPGVGDIDLAELKVGSPLHRAKAEITPAVRVFEKNTKSDSKVAPEVKRAAPIKVAKASQTMLVSSKETLVTPEVAVDISQFVQITQTAPEPRDVTQVVQLTQADPKVVRARLLPFPEPRPKWRSVVQDIEITQATIASLRAEITPRPGSFAAYSPLPMPSMRAEVIAPTVQISEAAQIPADFELAGILPGSGLSFTQDAEEASAKDVAETDLNAAEPAVRKRDAVAELLVRDSDRINNEAFVSKSNVRVKASAKREVSHLGSVVFDDRYAVPAKMDFRGGRDAGGLQKMPKARPNIAKRVSRVEPAEASEDIRRMENQIALDVSRGISGPVDFAQVPPSLSAKESDKLKDFSFEEPEPKTTGRLADLLEIKEGGDQRIPQIAKPAILENEPDDEWPAPSQTSTASDVVLDEVTAQTTTPPANGFAKPVLKSQDDAWPTNLVTGKGTDAAAATAPEPELQPVVAPQRPLLQAKPAAPAPTIAARKPAIQTEEIAQKPAPKAQASVQAPLERAVSEEPVLTEREKRAAAMVLLEQIANAQASETQVQEDQDQLRRNGIASFEQRTAPQATQGNMRPAPATAIGQAFDRRQATGETAQRASGAQSMERINSLRDAPAKKAQPQAQAADLRIELSYVASRSSVNARVAELRSFFPKMMLSKGRFYGASIPGTRNMYTVGIQAVDIEARDTLVWYLEQMGMPYAFRK